MLISLLQIHRFEERFTHSRWADILQRHLISIAGIVSVCLSVFVLLHDQPINTDGILYLQSSTAFVNSGIKAAMQIYAWPLYAILIGSISQLTSLSVLHSAYVLNALLDVCTVVVFIQLSRELTPQKPIPLLAAIVILSFPFLNHARDAIIRGHAYFPLALLSFLLMIRYSKTLQWRDALALGIAMLFATLFRVEGAALLCFAPLAILFSIQGSVKNRAYYTLKAYSVQIIVALFIFCFLLLNTPQHPEPLGRTHMILDQLQHGFVQIHDTLVRLSTQLRTQVLPVKAHDQAMTIMISGVIGIFLFKTVKTLGLINVFFAGVGLNRSTIKFPRQAVILLMTFLFLTALTSLMFTGQRQYLSGRHVGLLALLLLLYVPLGLNHVISQFVRHHEQRRWQVLIFVTLLAFLYMAIQGLIYFGPSKTYIVKTGEWIQQHVPINSKLYTNNSQLHFYAQRKGSRYPVDFIKGNNSFEAFYHYQWHNYNYLAFKIRHHHHQEEQKLLSYLKLKPIKSFHNRRGDKTLVFKVP